MTRILVPLAIAIVSVASIGCTTTEQPRDPKTEQTLTTVYGVPGGIFTTTTEVSVRVTATDTAKCTLTVLTADKKTQVIGVPKEAINFDQIVVGDLVVLTLSERVAIAVCAAGVPIEQGVAAVVALAEKGQSPSGAVVTAVQIRATVTAIDLEKRTATVVTDSGETRIIPVRNDIDLSKHKVGDQVIMRVIEVIAVHVEKAPTPAK
jgi:hypothetical protein